MSLLIYFSHVFGRRVLLVFYRKTDPSKIIAQPGPCNIEKRGLDMTQKEFLSV